MSKAWGGGSTTAWRRLRVRVLARDGYQCKIAIAGLCTGRATCVHHVHGKAYGDDPAQLVAACQPCNARVNDPARTSTHQQVIAWVRAQPPPVTVRAIVDQFPRVGDANLRKILARAVRRAELVSAGYGRYRPGPTGLPPVLHDPPPRPRTRW